MTAQVLLADDDASIRFVLSQALAKEGFAVRATSNVATLAKWAKEGEGDVILSDVYMGEDNVFDALPSIRALRPDLPIIVMSAQSTVATAFSATNAGAFDYVPKPFDLDALIACVRRALAGGPDAAVRASIKKAARDENLPLVGRSPAMQEAFRAIAKVANSDLAVLIEGESGTGKTRVARALHENSKQARGPFVAASVAGLSAAQIDAEIFGADGAYARARGGVLFLQHVDDLPAEGQSSLAGRLNDDSTLGRHEVRLVAAAQRALAGLARQDRFRQDLLQRLNVVVIRLPPLRERVDDIADLARAFLLRAQREGLPEKALEASAVKALEAHDFPGNIRELENILRRAAAMSPGPLINAGDITAMMDRAAPVSAGPTNSLEAAVAGSVERAFADAKPGLPEAGLYDRLLADFERPLIARALAATRGNQIRAAAVLGINRNTLRKKIQALGLSTGARD